MSNKIHKTLIIYSHGSLDNTGDIFFNAPENKPVVLFNNVGNIVTLPIEKIDTLKEIYKTDNSLYKGNDKDGRLTEEGTKWINSNKLFAISSDGNIKQLISLQHYYNYVNNVNMINIPNLLLDFTEDKCGAELIIKENNKFKSILPVIDLKDKIINLKDLIETYKDINTFIIIACLKNSILDKTDLNLLKKIVAPFPIKAITRSRTQQRNKDIQAWKVSDYPDDQQGYTPEQQKERDRDNDNRYTNYRMDNDNRYTNYRMDDGGGTRKNNKKTKKTNKVKKRKNNKKTRKRKNIKIVY